MYQLHENVNGTRPASNLLQIVTFEAQTLAPRNHLYPHKPFLGTDVYNTRWIVNSPETLHPHPVLKITMSYEYRKRY